MSTAHDHHEPPSIPFEDLPDRLRRSRKRMGWDQVDIAARLGIHQRTVANYETGHTEPKRSVLLAWATLTNVPVDWLTFGMEECSNCRDRSPRSRCFSTEPQVSDVSNVVPVDFGTQRCHLPAEGVTSSTDATVHEFPPAE